MDRRTLPTSRRDVLRLGAAAAGLSVLAPAVAACGGSGAPKGAVKLSGWDYESVLVQQNVSRFESKNKDVKVSYTPITGSQYVQKSIAEFTAGDGPDALYVYDESLAGWVDAGYLQPIDGLPGVDRVYADLYPSNADAMTIGGKRYGLPYYTDSSCLIYNGSILAKAGIKSAPKSLDELEQQCLKIKNAGLQQYPIGLSALLSDASWGWIWSLVYAAGGDMFDRDGTPTLDGKDPATREVFRWLQHACLTSKIIDPAAPQLLPVQLDNAIKTERYAYAFAARYGLRDYNDPKKSKVAGKFKIGYVPSLDGKVVGTVSTTRMYCLAKDTEVKDKAFRLLSYLGGLDASGVPYTAKFWAQQRGLGFAYRSLEKDQSVRQAVAKFSDPEIYAKLAAVARPRTVLKQPWYSEFETQLQKTLQQIMNGTLDPDSAVRTLAASAKSFKQKYA